MSYTLREVLGDSREAVAGSCLYFQKAISVVRIDSRGETRSRTSSQDKVPVTQARKDWFRILWFLGEAQFLVSTRVRF